MDAVLIGGGNPAAARPSSRAGVARPARAAGRHGPIDLRWIRAGLLLLALAWPAASLAAEADPAGSRDPYGVQRYPRSWIVDYRRDLEARPREFVMSRVDRIRRDMRVEDGLRVEATLETVTYRIPEGVAVDEVVVHFSAELGSDVLFRCRGRDCGRSNDWANQVFEQATLYGPDRNQFYGAWEWQGKLVAVYVIERGNKRVYAHLRFIEPADAVGVAPNVLMVRRLTERGWAPVESVTPGRDGALTDADRSVLGALGADLARFADRPIYVVCHLHGAGPVEALVDASGRCAEAAAAAILGGVDGTEGTALPLRGFGAGPLLPRPVLDGSRLEIVLPDRIDRRRD